MFFLFKKGMFLSSRATIGKAVLIHLKVTSTLIDFS